MVIILPGEFRVLWREVIGLMGVGLVSSQVGGFEGGAIIENKAEVEKGEAGEHGAEKTGDDEGGEDLNGRPAHFAPVDFDEIRDEAGSAEDGEQGGVEDEEDEALVVALAHAVVDPGAVVVHFGDAAVAYGAVVGAGRLLEVALDAQRVLATMAALGTEGFEAPAVGNGARVQEDAGEVGPQAHDEEEVVDQQDGDGQPRAHVLPSLRHGAEDKDVVGEAQDGHDNDHRHRPEDPRCPQKSGLVVGLWVVQSVGVFLAADLSRCEDAGLFF